MKDDSIAHAAYELRFPSLFDEGRAFAFPCDAAGRVDLDALSERLRMNYLYARAVVGREVRWPSVEACVASERTVAGSSAHTTMTA